MRTVNSRTEIRLIGNRITQRQEAGGRDIRRSGNRCYGNRRTRKRRTRNRSTGSRKTRTCYNRKQEHRNSSSEKRRTRSRRTGSCEQEV